MDVNEEAPRRGVGSILRPHSQAAVFGLKLTTADARVRRKEPSRMQSHPCCCKRREPIVSHGSVTSRSVPPAPSPTRLPMEPMSSSAGSRAARPVAPPSLLAPPTWALRGCVPVDLSGSPRQACTHSERRGDYSRAAVSCGSHGGSGCESGGLGLGADRCPTEGL